MNQRSGSMVSGFIFYADDSSSIPAEKNSKIDWVWPMVPI